MNGSEGAARMPLDAQDTPVAASRRKSRRSSSKSQKGLKSVFVAKLVRGAVVIALLAALVVAGQQLRLASLMFGPLTVGMPEQEVLYLRGQPDRRDASGNVWTYDDGLEARTLVSFGPNRNVQSITCASVTGGTIGCPAVLGLELGADQDQLVDRLGRPTSERYIPNGKILAYSDIGLHFTMRQYRITGVTKTSRTTRVAYLGRLPWIVLP